MSRWRLTTMSAMAKTTAATEPVRIVNRYKLIELRTKEGLLQSELGKKAGVYQGTISKLERGEMGKGGEKCAETVHRIAQALGVAPEVLYEPPSADFIPPVRTPRGYSRAVHPRKVRHKNRRQAAPGLRSKPILSPDSSTPPMPKVPADSHIDRSVADNPLVTAIMRVAAADLKKFSWKDIQTAVETALESVAYLSAGADSLKLARVLLESARVNRMKLNGQVASPIAVVVTALDQFTHDTKSR